MTDQAKKTRKQRSPKALPAGDILMHFMRLSLEDKLNIQKAIVQDIAAEKKKLEEQLKLIG